MTRTCAWQVDVWWRTRAPGSRARALERYRSSSRMSMGQSSSGFSCEIDAWGGLGDNLSVRKVKAHTTPEAVLAGIITADDRDGNACKLVGTGTPRPGEHSRCEALSQFGRHAHVHSTWLLGRGRATARRRGRERPWSLPLLAHPNIWRRGHTFVDSASRRIRALCQHPERATRGRCPGAVGAQAQQAPECAAQRNGSGLTALRTTELLISCREARWCQCSTSCVARTVVAWCGNRCQANALVLRRLGDCWLCMTCCWFPAWFQAHCTTRQYSGGMRA